MKLFSSHLFSIFKSLLAVFASSRGSTIAVLVIAQYLSARYILAPNRSWLEHLYDYRLVLLVLTSSFSIAGGYLINNFYDAEKDRINRPRQYLMHHILPPKQQLRFYFGFNLAALVMASWISAKVFLFFLAYILGIWLYSHGLKKTFWASNFFAALLAITPFFVMGLYFKNLSQWVMYHAFFLFLMILIRDLVKDLFNYKGDWVNKYNTIAVHFGVNTTKKIITGCIAASLLPVGLLFREKTQLGAMYYYFLFCIPYLIGILIFVWKATDQKMYLWIQNLLKLLILTGVGSIVLVRYAI